MRSDYGLYGVAIICFIIAAIFGASQVLEYTPAEPLGITVIVIFLLLGIISLTVGYSVRPKAALPTPKPAPTLEEPAAEMPPPTAPAMPTPLPPAEEVAPEPTPPTPPSPTEPSPPAVTVSAEPEEPMKVAEEAPKAKPTRRRRKKAQA